MKGSSKDLTVERGIMMIGGEVCMYTLTVLVTGSLVPWMAARLGGLPSTCRRYSCFQILLAELVLPPNSDQGLTLMVWIVEDWKSLTFFVY